MLETETVAPCLEIEVKGVGMTPLLPASSSGYILVQYMFCIACMGSCLASKF